MMHRAWSSTVEVPYCFSRSSVKFQGHTALKIVEFDPNWAFPDCNTSLNLPMAMKCCTKLETAKERCSIVFLGHPWNFKVTRYKTSPILTQIGRFRTIGRSQLSNPSDLPCWTLITQNLTNDMPQLSLIANYKNILDSIMKQLSLPYWYLTSTYSSQHINHFLPGYAYSVILHSNTPNKNISWTVKYLCKIPTAYVDYSL